MFPQCTIKLNCCLLFFLTFYFYVMKFGSHPFIFFKIIFLKTLHIKIGSSIVHSILNRLSKYVVSYQYDTTGHLRLSKDMTLQLHNTKRQKKIFFKKCSKFFFQINYKILKKKFLFSKFFFRKTKRIYIPFCVFLCCVMLFCVISSYGNVLCGLD